jgi:hypothetical protein
VVLAGVVAHADSSVPETGGGGKVLASLERTACYGRCPIYTVTVLRDGTVQWEGKHFVKLTGKASARLPAAKLAELADAFQKAGYFALKDKYTRYDVTDHPSANLSYDDGTHKKAIAHYHGDRSAPAVLDELEERIDEIVGTSKWIGRDQR